MQAAAMQDAPHQLGPIAARERAQSQREVGHREPNPASEPCAEPQLEFELLVRRHCAGTRDL
jgi:hypothetical protein